eukprot:377096_1
MDSFAVITLTILFIYIPVIYTQSSCFMDTISSSTMHLNDSLYFGFTDNKVSYVTNPPCISSGVKSQNNTLLVNQCLNTNKLDINLNFIIFKYQFAIGYCKDNSTDPPYPSFKLYLVNVDQKNQNNLLIYQKHYNRTNIKLHCFQEFSSKQKIEAFSQIQTEYIFVNKNLNQSIYQFKFIFFNGKHNSYLLLNTLSLKINTTYLSLDTTTTQYISSDDSIESSEQTYTTVFSNIYKMVIGILLLFLLICCCVMARVTILYKRKQKQLKYFQNDYHYRELTHVQAVIPITSNNTQINTIDDHEGEIEELEFNNDMYAKPITGTKHLTANNQLESQVLHFYYMDYVYEGDMNENKNNQKDKQLYHEKQQLEMCLVHSLNALLQRKQFTRQNINEICKELAPDKIINPHKSFLQTGNYDANVLMSALQKIHIDIEWFDARKVNEINLNDDNLFWNYLECKDNVFIGFILNIPSKAMFKMIKRRHWITIKQINGIWYNLDSKLKKPQQYQNAQQLTEYLQYNLNTNNAQLMICRKKNKYVIMKAKAEITW